jgi:hypothetical protein
VLTVTPNHIIYRASADQADGTASSFARRQAVAASNLQVYVVLHRFQRVEHIVLDRAACVHIVLHVYRYMPCA